MREGNKPAWASEDRSGGLFRFLLRKSIEKGGLP